MSEPGKYDPNATNPMGSAQANMRAPVIKRFFKQAAVAEVDGGYALQLDGRNARTPGKAPLVAPRRAIAELIAAEWSGQGEIIEPWTMPATRLANSAIDGVAKTLAETRAEIAKYAGTDLVCYRADEPDELVAMQAEAHDPVLAWARETLDAPFVVAKGVMFVAQPGAALDRIEAAIGRYDDPFAVASLHVLTSLSGSALLALMLARGARGAQKAGRAAPGVQDFQIRKWGEDDEAKQRREARWSEFATAAKVIAAI
jgi:chaperone required for assembly of F1-ATPase